MILNILRGIKNVTLSNSCSSVTFLMPLSIYRKINECLSSNLIAKVFSQSWNVICYTFQSFVTFLYTCTCTVCKFKYLRKCILVEITGQDLQSYTASGPLHDLHERVWVSDFLSIDFLDDVTNMQETWRFKMLSHILVDILYIWMYYIFNMYMLKQSAGYLQETCITK